MKIRSLCLLISGLLVLARSVVFAAEEDIPGAVLLRTADFHVGVTQGPGRPGWWMMRWRTAAKRCGNRERTPSGRCNARCRWSG